MKKNNIKVKVKFVKYETLYKTGERVEACKEDLSKQELELIGMRMYDRGQKARGYHPSSKC